MGLHRGDKGRRREVNRLKLQHPARRTERIVRDTLGQLGEHADVAGANALEVSLLFAAHGEDVADTLVFARATVDEHTVGFHFTRKDAEVTDFAVGVRNRLEDQGRGWLVGRGVKGNGLIRDEVSGLHRFASRRRD